MRLRELIFDFGRRIGKRPVASRLFSLFERALPLHRLARSRRAVAFCHPRPVYEPHVLVVPTRPFPALTHDRLSDENKADLLWEMIDLAFQVTADDDADWQMIINGGTRQEIGQVHGHLIYDDHKPADYSIAMVDPKVQFGGWEHLFQWVGTADDIPNNGYSVTFRLIKGGDVSASFSKSEAS